MRILVVDVGTGTQDILLFDSSQALENCVQMVMPSPTALVAERVRVATGRREPIVLTGVTAGGGPSMWAVEDHLRAGLPVYATPLAAQTFDDDLDRIRAMGIRLVDESEAARLDGTRVELRDFYYRPILAALEAFGVEPRLDAVAVAVFDHGAAPPGESDRKFRFRYLAETLDRARQTRGDARDPAPAGASLAAFAHRREAIPASMTRMASVARTVPPELPLLVMDTGPAAALGALQDPRVGREDPLLVVNVGNFHCLAFHFERGRVVGLFEHHTGELTPDELVGYLDRLGRGVLTSQEVFEDMGHGAIVWPRLHGRPRFCAVTGPRRAMLRRTRLDPYFAVPHGDMMLAGCFGLLRASASRMPEWGEEIRRGLDGTVHLA
ncbi:MAG TPA: DUF1786 domain-containing protein [Chloroflexota bacterium]